MATIEYVRNAAGEHAYAGYDGDACLGRLDCRDGSWIENSNECVGAERLELLGDADADPMDLARVAMECYRRDRDEEE